MPFIMFYHFIRTTLTVLAQGTETQLVPGSSPGRVIETRGTLARVGGEARPDSCQVAHTASGEGSFVERLMLLRTVGCEGRLAQEPYTGSNQSE